MSTNSSKSNVGSASSGTPQNIFYIKFGDQYFEIHEHHIAYAYYIESLLIVVHGDGQKLPVSGYNLQTFYKQINQNQFFKISDTTIVNRNMIFHFEEYEEDILLWLNYKTMVTFKIAANKIRTFKNWLNYQS